MTWEELTDRLAAHLTPDRLQHSLGVVETAARLAVRWGAAVAQARLAGLLHDCAKGLTADELLQWAAAFGIVRSDTEIACPDLLHGPVGALLAWKEYGVTDRAVLTAIRLHTLGAPDMGLLDKLIYLADYIEPGRAFPGVEDLRRRAEQDLNQAVLRAMDGTIRYVLERGLPLHPQTVAARNQLLREAAETGERGKHDRGEEKAGNSQV
ncbi:MAG TPA: HD domain-containing protein [Firmicutes bacterium]|nr:HD domain-containing protein [Bacillota bacterium]